MFDLSKPFCLYAHVYGGRHNINYGLLSSAYKFKAYPSTGSITVEIYGFYETLDDARVAFLNLKPPKEPKPARCGRAPKARREKDWIFCPQTGRSYRTINDAALVTDVHPSAISSHMRGRKGYEHPKGFEFARIPASVAHMVVRPLPRLGFPPGVQTQLSQEQLDIEREIVRSYGREPDF